MQAIEQALRSLRDVQGVHGSFVITTSGALVARDLPSIFDNQLFLEVGPRISRLHETFLSGGEEMDACLLRYAEHKLYIRKTPAALLGILSGVSVNMPALRMVSNLVIRAVDPLVADLATKASAASAPQAVRANGASSSVPAAAPVPVVIMEAPARSSDPWIVDSAPTTSGSPPRPSVVPEDGRDPAQPHSDRHVRMYRGRRVED